MVPVVEAAESPEHKRLVESFSTHEKGRKDMTQNSPSTAPLRDDKQFLIAIAFIAGFFILMSISLAQYFVSANLEAVKLVGAIFGGWVGAIIGFYFGQKPVEQVKQTLDAERQRTKELTDYITGRSTEMWEKFEKKKEEE